jgi:ribosomal protein S18 acetylase RimI-like enzyme
VQDRPSYGKDSPNFEIKAAVAADVPELARLFDAYRVFYEAVSMPVKSEAFVHGLLTLGNTRFFLAREAPVHGEKRPSLGFVHLIPSINTVAMRAIWYLEDLYVAADNRRRGVATSLMRHAETFARETGAERLTLATASNNKRAQSLYQRLGYVPEDHFRYYHRILD